MPWFFSPQGDGVLPQAAETILSFDPGGTTGWCTYTRSTKEFETGSLSGVHHITLWELLHTRAPDMVIYESFDYQRRDIEKGVNLNIDARNYIGIIELYCLEYQLPCYRSALSNKAFWRDDKLKAIKPDLSKVIHEKDAMRHLLHWLTFREGDQSWIRKLYTPR